MLKAFLNMWKIPDLRNKILFTLGMLVIYRFGHFIGLFGINNGALKEAFEKNADTALGNLAQYVSIFTGGTFEQSSIFGLGVMPYISASIIFQLLATVLPQFQALKKEGAQGQQKIMEYTRYATVALAVLQGGIMLSMFQRTGIVYAEYAGTTLFWVCGITALVTGTVFLMWVGEQIDKYGIGNGVSLIITAGIVARMPDAVRTIYSKFNISGGGSDSYGADKVAFIVFAFIVVVAGAILITQGQRRIMVHQAKHTRGPRVYGGQKTYLPLRVNHGGVMPIIFASSLMMIPTMLIGWIQSTLPPVVQGVEQGWWPHTVNFIQINLQHDQYPYILIYIIMIYAFSYFWTTVQFQPNEIATQLRDHGSFIQGIRPGPRTAEYLEKVMERITYVGAAFLALIAVVPTVIHGALHVDMAVSSFLGGTGLLIVISVMLDFIQRIEAALMMRNYQGFLSESGKSHKIRGGMPN
jgi:preprotein translocase subunit SecY